MSLTEPGYFSYNILDFLIFFAYFEACDSYKNPLSELNYPSRILFFFQFYFNIFLFVLVFRCMKIALVHDLAECIVGDITPFCGISPEEKEQKERVCMIICNNLV